MELILYLSFLKRGDSLDTVFTSSPPIQGGRRSTSPGPSRHHAASANALNCPSSYYGGPGSLSSRHAQSHPSFYSGQGNGRNSGRSSGYREWSGAAESGHLVSGSGSSGAVMVADVTGNLARLSDSVILDIGESSSSSSSSSKINMAEVDDDEEEEDPRVRDARNEEDIDDGEGGLASHNDWEVQMLAAEMERQERKRGHSLSDNLGELKHCSTFLRRRRKFSDTETEFSETDMEEQLARSGSGPMEPSGSAPSSSGAGGSTSAGHQSGSQRPRASSLDQFNLRYGIGRGIFKAMSIDRDKDKL